MEKTDEWQGAGMEYTTEYRQYDPRLGRWMSLDPLMAMFPHISPFVAYENNPIYFVDPYGLAPGNGDENGNGTIFPENPKAGETVTDASSGTVYTYEGITGKWVAQLNIDAYGGYLTWTVDENGAVGETMYFPATGNYSEMVVSSGTYQHVESTNALFGLIENEGLQAYEISYDIILKTREYENRVESETDYRVTNIKSTWSSHSLNIGVYTVALTEAAAVRVLRTALSLSKGSYINLASAARTNHIIAGDATGGGHSWFGSLRSFINGLTGSKSMFPATWSNSKIMHAISDVVVNNPWIQQTGKAGAMYTKSGQPVRFVVEGTYQGTKIRVVTTHTDIITAFPIK